MGFGNMHERTVAIIPAKVISRRLPGKNRMDFCGMELSEWSIYQARNNPYITDIIFTSDIETVTYNMEGVFNVRRPPMLTGSAPSADFVLHAVWEWNTYTNMIPDLIVLLQPTGVCREQWMIDMCLEIGNAYTVTDGKPNGAVYVNLWKYFEVARSFSGVPVEAPCIDIDTAKDFKAAEKEMRRRMNGESLQRYLQTV